MQKKNTKNNYYKLSMKLFTTYLRCKINTTIKTINNHKMF